MTSKPRIVVLCTGNSCRSQMAEGYLRRFAGERFFVDSAGTEPKDAVHPLAVQVMAEDGVDISTHWPKNIRPFTRMQVDYLITVCGNAAACPVAALNAGETLHWPFEDPDAFKGSPSAVLDEFRRIRNQIKEQIAAWLPTV